MNELCHAWMSQVTHEWVTQHMNRAGHWVRRVKVSCGHLYEWVMSCVNESYYSVLQCVAVCCGVLQCVAGGCGAHDQEWIFNGSCCRCIVVHCSASQCVAVCCGVLQCVAVCCSVLRCVAVCCSWMRRSWPRADLQWQLLRPSKWMSHVTCEWVLTYECVMPYMNASYHIWMRHIK